MDIDIQKPNLIYSFFNFFPFMKIFIAHSSLCFLNIKYILFGIEFFISNFFILFDIVFDVILHIFFIKFSSLSTWSN